MSDKEVGSPEPQRLLRRRAELRRRHELVAERVALFPNAANRRQLEDLAGEILLAEQRLRELRGE